MSEARSRRNSQQRPPSIVEEFHFHRETMWEAHNRILRRLDRLEAVVLAMRRVAKALAELNALLSPPDNPDDSS